VAEKEDSTTEVQDKIQQLSAMFLEASHVVVHTGAGISTSAGIPDFRGKTGVWTRHKAGEALPAAERCWNNAQPTSAHMILASLVAAGRVQAVVTQNIDGLHLRSGIPRECLAELHGNIFAEKCSSCGLVVARSFDCGGVGFRPTGRSCHVCSGEMIDQLLDWEDDLPERDFDLAEDHAEKCEAEGGLAICLGTSMQMTPARDWPCRARRMVIVNLQPTIKDDEAALVIRAPIDQVLSGVLAALQPRTPNLALSPFQRVETFVVSHERQEGGAQGGRGDDPFVLRVLDRLGAPLGFILNVKVISSCCDMFCFVRFDSVPSIHQL
jgi:mono-ADP-ribosyltransferase sirtuin 6